MSNGESTNKGLVKSEALKEQNAVRSGFNRQRRPAGLQKPQWKAR